MNQKINLIGITGRMMSGKDLTANIIQYLVYCKNNSKMSYSSWQLLQGNPYSGWEIKKFAQKLKQIASILTGIREERFEDQELKKQIMPIEWQELIYGGTNENAHYTEHTYRQFLQVLGTDCVRDGLHPDCWTNALFADFKPVHMPGLEFHTWDPDPMPSWIISDVRFPNEYHSIKSRGGIIIRKNGAEEFSSAIQNMHASETALDGFVFDYELDYCEEIETLVAQIKEILIKENIL